MWIYIHKHHLLFDPDRDRMTVITKEGQAFLMFQLYGDNVAQFELKDPGLFIHRFELAVINRAPIFHYEEEKITMRLSGRLSGEPEQRPSLQTTRQQIDSLFNEPADEPPPEGVDFEGLNE